MHIEPFKVEIWMNEWETQCELNLAETCVESITIDELLKLSGRNDTSLAELLPMKMTYGEIEGSARLRQAVCDLYEKQEPENITITHGTIGANMLVHRTLVSSGDHVVSVVPTYQQHYSIPDSIGANVELLELQPEDGFLPDLNKLRSMVSEKTKMIALTNPNNPTGALIERPMLEEIASIARASDAYVLCDEVYRGTAQVGDGMSASIADIYEMGISTASMSKAFSLAGLRLGWIAAPKELHEAIMIQRDYDTISVGMINDHFSAIALEDKGAVLARSHSITRNNLAILDEWVQSEKRVDWVKPQAGTTAMLHMELPMTAREFCLKLIKQKGVLLMPGDAFDMEGYVRIGFANNTEVLKSGLLKISEFLATLDE